MVVRSRGSDGSIQETETKRVHTYGKAWALQVRGSRQLCLSCSKQPGCCWPACLDLDARLLQ